LFNDDEEAEEMNALSEIDDIPLKKGKTKSKTPKAVSLKKKAPGKRGNQISEMLQVKHVNEVKKPRAKSLASPSIGNSQLSSSVRLSYYFS
jgi:hypothetical protein